MFKNENDWLEHSVVPQKKLGLVKFIFLTSLHVQSISFCRAKGQIWMGTVQVNNDSVWLSKRPKRSWWPAWLFNLITPTKENQGIKWIYEQKRKESQIKLMLGCKMVKWKGKKSFLSHREAKFQLQSIKLTLKLFEKRWIFFWNWLVQFFLPPRKLKTKHIYSVHSDANEPKWGNSRDNMWPLELFTV